jgi:hypothetical protein
VRLVGICPLSSSGPDLALTTSRSRSAQTRLTHKINGVRWLKELPLGFRLYFWLWTLFVPAGVALLLAGAVVPGLVLLALFVVDQAVFVPLIVARVQRQRRAASGQE